MDPILVKSAPLAASLPTTARSLVPNARRTRMPISMELRAAIVPSIRLLIRGPRILSNAGPPIVPPERSGSEVNALAVMRGRTLRERTRGFVCSASLVSRPTSESESCSMPLIVTLIAVPDVLSPFAGREPDAKRVKRERTLRSAPFASLAKLVTPAKRARVNAHLRRLGRSVVGIRR